MSCESQLRAMRERAAGETVVLEKEDRGVSHFEAQGFMELIEAARKSPRPFDKVYVYDTSRIGRDRVRQAVYMQEMERTGVELCILNLPESADKITDMMIKAVYGVLDEMHSLKSARDAKRGMRENILQGYRAGGPPPYGYRLVREQRGENRRGEPVFKSRLEPDEQAPVVWEIFERAAGGESRASIARELTRRGVKRARGGTRWTTSAIHSILGNWRIYQGDGVWNRSGSRQRKRSPSEPRRRTTDAWVVARGVHPGIVTVELAQAARARSTTRDEPAPRVESVNVLAGLLHCGVCGARMQSWGEGRLVCPISMRGEGRCDCPSITHDLVVAGVLEAVEREVRWEGRAEEVARELVRAGEERRDWKELDERIGGIERKISRWRAALEVTTSDLEAVQVQTENLDPLYRDLEEALAERVRMEREYPPPLTYEEALAGVRAAFDRFSGIASTTPPEDLRALFRACIERMEFRPAKQFGAERHSVSITWTPYRGSLCSGTGARNEPRYRLEAELAGRVR